MRLYLAAAAFAFSTFAIAQNIEITPSSTNSGVPLSNTTVVHPGGYGAPTLTGPGFNNGSCDPTRTNTVGKLNENWCSSADTWVINSSDPSAGLNLPFTGTPVAGDVYTLNFHYNATTVSVTYTVAGGDTLVQVIQGLAAQILGNSTLYGAGFAGGKLVAYAVYLPGDSLAIDANAAIPLKMSYSVTGGHSEVITFPPGFNASGPITGGSAQNTQYDVASSTTIPPS
jgi:hypothetical protein